jgi:hypothetical protein
MGENTETRHAFVHQIYYDEESRRQLDPGFIPLDNSTNARPDWYEFWAIRNYLKQNVLQDDALYGFLSPRFVEKTGCNSETMYSILQQCDAQCDAVLFSTGWDQIAYFRNAFEQGELWHPGLTELTQNFLHATGVKIDLANMVTHSGSTVFSNYFLAKPKIWREWLKYADAFFAFVENASSVDYQQDTTYGSVGAKTYQTPIKTFIQERFITLILVQGRYKVFAPDQSGFAPIFERLFKENAQTRKLLQCCDMMKQRYCTSGDLAYLDMYNRIRAEIETHPQ